MGMTEPTNEEIADVLDGARDVLIERGWHQGGYEAATGEVCTAGAINVVLNGHPTVYVDQAPHVRCFTSVLAAETNERIAVWNDDPSTTEDDVHDLLLNTAKALREDA